MSKIKFDLEIKFGTQYGPEEEQAVLKVLRNNAPTSGDECIEFERMYAEYSGAKYARVVSNGTNALFLSMIGIDLKLGDHVITTPVTWIATAAAPVTLGAKVDFVDIDPVTYNLDHTQLEDKITPGTRAVLPVHLYGQACEMDEIMEIANKHGIKSNIFLDGLVMSSLISLSRKFSDFRKERLGVHRFGQMRLCPNRKFCLDVIRRIFGG